MKTTKLLWDRALFFCWGVVVGGQGPCVTAKRKIFKVGSITNRLKPPTHLMLTLPHTPTLGHSPSNLLTHCLHNHPHTTTQSCTKSPINPCTAYSIIHTPTHSQSLAHPPINCLLNHPHTNSLQLSLRHSPNHSQLTQSVTHYSSLTH